MLIRTTRTLWLLQAVTPTASPRAGLKVLTLFGATPRGADFERALRVDMNSYSRHVAVRWAADERSALDNGRAWSATTQRIRADARDALARQQHVSGDAAGRVHATAGRAA